ncbi:MAG: nicotinate phosphoribosyltransferase [Acidimicrobiales bacterium]|nr:nicotinate phosphoribosyltransferase [Acidimicrobiales bacterium]MBO0892885.1 nicotinate phosphoribosyltransferase [Acidimicrobiales bacterium]
MPGALITDLYELNMAASYLRRNMRAPATFSLFIRQLPASRGFLVAAGIDDSLHFLEQLRFEPSDLEYLAGLGFDDQTLASFAALRFSGDVWAVPEGRVVLADEPLLEVTAPIAEAQLVETALLNLVTFQTTLATKAARCRLAAAGRIELIEFGFRRTQGIDAGIAVARLSALAGFAATSNVEAARRYGLRPSGTMAHSYIVAFPTELEAFRAFAEDLPTQTTFLVDTYDTLEGVAHAIQVIGEHGLEAHSAIRLDSGDLVPLARAARDMLDRADLRQVRIIVSGGLDEHDLARFVAEGAPIDAAGVGTRLGVSADVPYLDSVYKLVAYDGRPVAKRSTGKATLPGAKQIFRGPAFADTLALREEAPPGGDLPLLEPVMVAGRRVRQPDSLPVARARLEADLGELPEDARHLVTPVPPVVARSPGLEQLTRQVQDATGA